MSSDYSSAINTPNAVNFCSMGTCILLAVNTANIRGVASVIAKGDSMGVAYIMANCVPGCFIQLTAVHSLSNHSMESLHCSLLQGDTMTTTEIKWLTDQCPPKLLLLLAQPPPFHKHYHCKPSACAFSLHTVSSCLSEHHAASSKETTELMARYHEIH